MKKRRNAAEGMKDRVDAVGEENVAAAVGMKEDLHVPVQDNLHASSIQDQRFLRKKPQRYAARIARLS